MDLSDLIERNAAFTPGRLALRFEGRDLSYGAFAARVAAVARGLQSSLRRAPRRSGGAAGGEPSRLLVLLFACARLGAMLVPLNWRLAVPELAFVLSDATPSVLFAGIEFAEAMAALQCSSRT